MIKRLSKRNWNTYHVNGYTHDVANDQSSAGGIHLHQVRCIKNVWEKRICQSNGNHQSYGPHERVSESEGQEWYRFVQHIHRIEKALEERRAFQAEFFCREQKLRTNSTDQS